MAWPGTLTVEEQTVVKVFVDEMFRKDVLDFIRSLNLSVQIKEDWDGRISAMFAKLAANDVIPSGSGLAGSQALTKTEVTAMLTTLQGVLTTYNTSAVRNAALKIIGGVNMSR